MIKLLRVDHRLLHGQVAMTWTQELDTNCILIACDAVVKDDVRKTTLKLARPAGVKLVIKSVDDSIEALRSGVTDKSVCSLSLKASKMLTAWQRATAKSSISTLEERNRVRVQMFAYLQRFSLPIATWSFYMSSVMPESRWKSGRYLETRRF